MRFAGPDGLLLSVLGVPVAGYDAACQWENEERERESLRLLYVVDTRAKDLLVLPRFSMEGNKPCWSKLCKARLAELPSFDLSAFEPRLPERPEPPVCRQTEADFDADAARIVEAHRTLTRRTPSRHEEGHEPVVVLEIVTRDEELVAGPVIAADIQGGPVRGSVLHKLIEEVLTGETAEDGLEPRAVELIAELGSGDTVDVAEAAATVRRTLTLPAITELRPRLLAEVDLAALSVSGLETLIVGVADALAVTSDGRIDVVVDWKSYVAPEPATLAAYRQQMVDYIVTVGAERGLIVLMTPARIVEVVPFRA